MEARSARRARPRFAKAWPSMAQAAAAALPGMLMQIAAIEPAYTAAFQIAIRNSTPVSARNTKVNGSSMVIAVAPDRPGIAPKHMPISTPPNIALRFISVKTSWKPCAIKCPMPNAFPPSLSSACCPARGPLMVGREDSESTRTTHRTIG